MIRYNETHVIWKFDSFTVVLWNESRSEEAMRSHHFYRNFFIVNRMEHVLNAFIAQLLKDFQQIKQINLSIFGMTRVVQRISLGMESPMSRGSTVR